MVTVNANSNFVNKKTKWGNLQMKDLSYVKSLFTHFLQEIMTFI